MNKEEISRIKRRITELESGNETISCSTDEKFLFSTNGNFVFLKGGRRRWEDWTQAQKLREQIGESL